MVERPHLLLVPAFLGAHGGFENLVLANARTAVDAGYRVTVVTPRRLPDGEVRPALEDVAAVDDAERHWLATPQARAWRTAARAKRLARRAGEGAPDSLALHRARPFIDRFWQDQGRDLLIQADLVHAYGKPKEFVRNAIEAAADAGIPTVYTEVAQVTEDYVQRPDLRRFPEVVNRCDRVLVFSEGQARDVAGRFGFRGEVAVVEQGAGELEGPLLAIRRPRPADGRVHVGSLCRLSPEKGLDTLVRAFARVAAGHPEADLSVAGTGELGEWLQRLVDDLDVEDRVDLRGFVDDRSAFYGQLDVFTIGSDVEGGPITGVEAMAAGLPVITTPCGAMPERVRDGEEGVVVEPGDVSGLAAALSRLIADAAARQAMGAAARQRYRARNANAVNEAALLDVWRSLLDHPDTR